MQSTTQPTPHPSSRPHNTTLRAAGAQHRALDAQLAQMQRLQAQAKAMQSAPRQSPEEAMRQLEGAIRQQGQKLLEAPKA